MLTLSISSESFFEDSAALLDLSDLSVPVEDLEEQGLSGASPNLCCLNPGLFLWTEVDMAGLFWEAVDEESVAGVEYTTFVWVPLLVVKYDEATRTLVSLAPVTLGEVSDVFSDLELTLLLSLFFCSFCTCLALDLE